MASAPVPVRTEIQSVSTFHEPKFPELFIIGFAGRVATALLKRLRDYAPQWPVRALVNRHGLHWFNDPLPVCRLDLSAIKPHPFAMSTTTAAWSAVVHGQGIVLDLTASSEVQNHYPHWLKQGLAVVTPNKHTFAANQQTWDELLRLSEFCKAPLRFSTTAGAALPFIHVLQQLRQSGEPVSRIRATLSGTVAFVLEQIQRGERFSHAVKLAVGQGLAEPDPRADLAGLDVARKLLILARTAGFKLEPEQIHRQPIIAHDEIRDLTQFDAPLAQRVLEVQRANQKLIYAAQFDSPRARCGLLAVPVDDPLASGQGTDNVLVVETPLYSSQPLIVRGPGAGPAHTAQGLMADMGVAARALQSRVSAPILHLDVAA
jgi:homoserine dehydrogenase